MTQQVQSRVLEAACGTGNFADIEQVRADVNRYDEKGGFLLIRFVYAASKTTEPDKFNRYVETLPRIITELQANVNLHHKKTGQTALHCAAGLGNLVAVRILLENHAEVNSRDQIQSTPLSYCASFAGNARVIEYLLSKGALVDAVTLSGQTALHFAVDQDQIENARVLLIHNADKQMCASNGRRPLQEAKNKAMRNLFSRTIEELRIEIEKQQTKRIGILLTKANPIQEAIESSDLAEANLLINHLQFTNNHLEEGFKFAFKNEFLKNYDFIFKLFAEKPSLNFLVQRILDDKLIEVNILQNKIITATKDRDLLRERAQDTRTAYDFDLGRGDFADQATAITEFQDYLRRKDYTEGLRVAELENQNIKIRSLSEDIARIKHQIEILEKLQNHFSLVDLEVGIQELAIK